jgi:ubiquinone/menaquinone biosynthesis C-methylase UbiE
MVLDVGSGHNPNRRANILLERELDASVHRSGARATIPAGKQLVIGDAQRMPFKTASFDFVIASHIAEHIPQPDFFLTEMARVGRHGYIETPGPLSETLLTEPYHLWILTRRGKELLFLRKQRTQPLSDLFYRWFYLNEERYGHTIWRSGNGLLRISRAIMLKMWKRMPGTYTKYHWSSCIHFRIQG